MATIIAINIILIIPATLANYYSDNIHPLFYYMYGYTVGMIIGILLPILT